MFRSDPELMIKWVTAFAKSFDWREGQGLKPCQDNVEAAAAAAKLAEPSR